MSKPSGLWYKSPWVWFIILILASAVTASLYTVYIVESLPNDLLPNKVNKFAMEHTDSQSSSAAENQAKANSADSQDETTQ